MEDAERRDGGEISDEDIKADKTRIPSSVSDFWDNERSVQGNFRVELKEKQFTTSALTQETMLIRIH